MESVTVTADIGAPADAVRAAITDVGPFMRAAEFDEVTVEGDIFHITNHVGLASIDLTLELFEDSEATLAYRQREGIFDRMVTRYVVGERSGGVSVRATTEFALAAPFVGPLLDATVVTRKRRVELNAQMEYLRSLDG